MTLQRGARSAFNLVSRHSRRGSVVHVASINPAAVLAISCGSLTSSRSSPVGTRPRVPLHDRSGGWTSLVDRHCRMNPNLTSPSMRRCSSSRASCGSGLRSPSARGCAQVIEEPHFRRRPRGRAAGVPEIRDLTTTDFVGRGDPYDSGARTLHPLRQSADQVLVAVANLWNYSADEYGPDASPTMKCSKVVTLAPKSRRRRASASSSGPSCAELEAVEVEDSPARPPDFDVTRQYTSPSRSGASMVSDDHGHPTSHQDGEVGLPL